MDFRQYLLAGYGLGVPGWARGVADARGGHGARGRGRCDGHAAPMSSEASCASWLAPRAPRR